MVMGIPHIIVTGNPVEGLEFYGPFDSFGDAAFFGANDPHLPADWWIALLHSPTDEEDK
jgi:hypothetical protein